MKLDTFNKLDFMHNSNEWMQENFQPSLVSVIVPTFNRANLLIAAMDSVLKQCYRPIELIIIDDGSTDETRKIVSDWGHNNVTDSSFRLRYLYQINAGAPAARNLGLIASTGEYIQFLDSDDELHPNRMQLIVTALKKNGADYVYTGMSGFCGRCKQVIQQHIPVEGGDPLSQFCQGKIGGSTLQYAWRRRLVIQIGPWNTDLAVAQDYDYIIRTLLISNLGVSVPKVLCYARRTGCTRISDIRYTRLGYECILHGATILCEGILSRNLPSEAYSTLCSQLYRTGIEAYSVCADTGKKFGKLASTLNCRPTTRKSRYEMLVHRAGKWACYIYLAAIRMKHCFYLRHHDSSSRHNCEINS